MNLTAPSHSVLLGPILSLRHLLFNATPEGYIVIFIILIVFALGFSRCMALKKRINRESFHLKIFSDNFLKYSLEAPISLAQYKALLDKVNLETFGQMDPLETIIGKRLSVIWSLRHSGRADALALQESFEINQELNFEEPRFFCTALVLLGLSGTIWGLQGLVSHFQGALNYTSQQVAGGGTDTNQLTNAFGQMSMAFSCTFYGIVTSLLLAYLVTRIGKKQNEFLSNLEDFLTRHIHPIVFPASDSSQFQQLAYTIEKSQIFIQQFGKAIETSQVTFTQTLQDAMSLIAKQFEANMTKSIGALSMSFEGVIGNVKEASGSLENSLTDMRSVASILSQSAQNLIQYRQELEIERQIIQTLLKETREKLFDLSESVLEPISEAAKNIASSQETVQQVKESIHADHADMQKMIIEAFDRWYLDNLKQTSFNLKRNSTDDIDIFKNAMSAMIETQEKSQLSINDLSLSIKEWLSNPESTNYRNMENNSWQLSGDELIPSLKQLTFSIQKMDLQLKKMNEHNHPSSLADYENDLDNYSIIQAYEKESIFKRIYSRILNLFVKR